MNNKNSNLPPGISVNDIPGNRPEDKEIDVILTFMEWELYDLKDFVNSNSYDLDNIKEIINEMINQIEDEECDAELCMNQLVSKNHSLNCEIGALKRTINELKTKIQKLEN